jgi:hypothetical protein
MHARLPCFYLHATCSRLTVSCATSKFFHDQKYASKQCDILAYAHDMAVAILPSNTLSFNRRRLGPEGQSSSFLRKACVTRSGLRSQRPVSAAFETQCPGACGRGWVSGNMPVRINTHVRPASRVPRVGWTKVLIIPSPQCFD